MKKNIKGIIIMFIMCMTLSACTTNNTPDKNQSENEKNIEDSSDNKSNEYNDNEEEKIPDIEQTPVNERIGDSLPVSRGLAAKMISLAYNSISEIKVMDNEAVLPDISEEDWYYKYVNCAIIQGIMNGDGEEFRPLEPLTLYEAQVLLDTINSKSKTKIKLTDENRNKPLSYTLWLELFSKALDEAGINSGFTERDIIVFATPGNSGMPSWKVATDYGVMGFEGFALDAYIDKKVKVLQKNGEIVALIEITENEPIINGAYIKNTAQNSAEITFGGGHRTVELGQSIALTESEIVANIKIYQDSISYLDKIGECISGDTTKLIDENKVELEKGGTINTIKNLPVYDITGEYITCEAISNIICGSDIADFYIKDGNVFAAVINKKASFGKLRVLISSTGYSGYTHGNEGVNISCTGEFTVKYTTGVKSYSYGDNVVIKCSENERVYIYPNEGEKIIINSVKRDYGNPQYRGNIEISKSKDGYTIVNEVGIEDYLYSVIPSEMPTSYGLEPAKVQAVAARSYAYRQYFANSYHSYGANIDDSVMCQVYNNVAENTNSINAVDSTKGMCITYGGEVISANFFSTSCGVTANNGEVWHSGTFPGKTLEYLKSKMQTTSGSYGDLSIEENMEKFIKSKNVESYDNNSGWFRWNLTMQKDELEAVINNNIAKVYQKTPHLVKTMQSDGHYRSRPIDNIGSLKSIYVSQRGEGGNAMKLVIKGTESEVLIMTELNIRTVLSPKQPFEGRGPIEIYCNKDVIMHNYSLMPSAFFVINKNQDGSYTFYGGGNGHGVGMSQNGVKGMSDNGYKFDEILSHYYEGTSIDTFEY